MARFSPVFVSIVLLIAVSACGAMFKLAFFGTTLSSDYIEYIMTAQALAGEEGASVSDNRILKPLNPLLVAALHPLFGYSEAMLFQALVFYFALVVAMFLFAREFFNDTRFATMVTLLSALSYPVLKYGVDVFAETGAWFFFVLSLLLTLKFVRTPRMHLFVINVAVVAVGFLWKEYSIVAGVILALATLLHAELSVREKILYSLIGCGGFLVVHVPWQLYVYIEHGFSYLTWYRQNAGAGFSSEFTLKNVVKSTAALLGLAWLLVPLGILKYRRLEAWQRRFLAVASPVPFIGFAWGYISSRLLYVIAPPFLLFAGEGLRALSRPLQYAVVALVIAANLTWLVLSYSITL